MIKYLQKGKKFCLYFIRISNSYIFSKKDTHYIIISPFLWWLWASLPHSSFHLSIFFLPWPFPCFLSPLCWIHHFLVFTPSRFPPHSRSATSSFKATVVSLSLCVLTSPPLSLSLPPPSSRRQTSLAAAASICSLFAANGPLVCCAQHHKSHQAGAQAAWLPLNVSQSGQFAMAWWAVLIWEQQLCTVRTNKGWSSP